VVFVDLVLAGDNAVVVGIVVASLPSAQRTRVMMIGITGATLMRVAFAAVTVQLLQIIGLLLAGGLLLLWVCWKLWRELGSIREARLGGQGGADETASAAVPAKTMRRAVLRIIVADLSMSLDNVLAVAGVARQHTWVLVLGLALSVAFMGLAAALIARLLDRHHWLAYVGLAIIFYVALNMIWEGAREVGGAVALEAHRVFAVEPHGTAPSRRDRAGQREDAAVGAFELLEVRGLSGHVEAAAAHEILRDGPLVFDVPIGQQDLRVDSTRAQGQP
jgi:YjbE family integral membrane protein